MKIVIPMAGMGKRMRPHTLTTPKPLIRLAGKSIVEHLVEEIAKAVKDPVEEIAFVMGHFGEEAEKAVLESARKIGARGRIYYQEEALGTAHAILCAADSLQGPVVVAFADTIVYCSTPLDLRHDAVIWTMKVDDPSAFGVVLTDGDNHIQGFVEKPKEKISDQAIIGIYFFKDGENLRNELQYLIDHNMRKGKEYQLTDALQNMMEKGLGFYSAEVDEWLDCGNRQATVQTHTRVLEHQGNFVSPGAELENSVVVPPCHIAENVKIKNSVIGPYVSVGAGSEIRDSRLCKSILQEGVKVRHTQAAHSMIGRDAEINGTFFVYSLSDYSCVEAPRVQEE